MAKVSKQRAAVPFGDDDIYQILTQALQSAKFPPGTKLGEQALADAFGVTRERIRKTLFRLGHERLVDSIPNRGSFVVNPSLNEMREIFEARRTLESGIVSRLAERVTDQQQALLFAHVKKEERAVGKKDTRASFRLSGRFHMLLAEMTGNSFVIRQMQELVIRTTMFDAFFTSNVPWSCGCEEHQTIAMAMGKGDGPGAVRAMTTHLALVETRFQPMNGERIDVDVDVKTIMRELIDAYARADSASEAPSRRRRREP